MAGVDCDDCVGLFGGFLAVMVRWLDVRKQGGRVAVSANYVLKWLTWKMHCNYSVLNKISVTRYPPSLFGKVWQSWCIWGLCPGDQN